MKHLLLSASSVLALGVIATPLHAQTTDADTQPVAEESQGGIDDIVVTAQRRSESVQDVPIAISAFSGDQLQKQGVASTLELGRFVPNLVSMNNTGIGTANAGGRRDWRMSQDRISLAPRSVGQQGGSAAMAAPRPICLVHRK